MHHVPVLKTLFVALLSIGFAGAASAQAASQAGSDASQPSQETAASSSHASKSAPVARSKISHRDRRFVENAVRSNMAEYELGKLAEQHASSPEVKQFAERMVSDHGKAGEALREVAQHNGITLPDKPKHSETREMGKLAKLTGTQFDRAYIDHMVKDHRKDVKEFQEQAQKAKDPEVKKIAEQMLPTLKEHLQMAEQSQAALGGAKGQAQPGEKSGKQ